MNDWAYKDPPFFHPCWTLPKACENQVDGGDKLENSKGLLKVQGRVTSITCVRELIL